MTDFNATVVNLRRLYPWPESRPDVPAVPWVMDYGGRKLIKRFIATRQPRLIFEIGAFVGGSVLQWLEASPDVTVVAIDPWPQITTPNVYRDSHPVGRLHAQQLREFDGLYHAFLANTWEHRDRIVPVRGKGVDMLPVLHGLGLRPELIFIDADKRAAEVQVCDELFPDAIVCGDDWLWSDGRGFPSQQPVRESARRRHRILKCVSNTWLIDDRPWTPAERMIWLRGMPTTLLRHITAWSRAQRGLASSGNPANQS